MAIKIQILTEGDLLIGRIMNTQTWDLNSQLVSFDLQDGTSIKKSLLVTIDCLKFQG